MISEKEFSSGFQDFWNKCLPFLTPQMFAELNATGNMRSKGRRNWIKPLNTSDDNSTNDVVSEAAFELFAKSLESGVGVETLALDDNFLENVVARALGRTASQRLRKGVVLQTAVTPPIIQVVGLADRLESYFRNHPKERPIVVQPQFKGCGVLDSCFGDLITPGHLYELKMGDRNLRSSDIKQALTYCTLNYFSCQYEFANIVILNPRRGSEYTFDIEELASWISGRTAAELFHDIREFLYGLETLHQGP